MNLLNFVKINKSSFLVGAFTGVLVMAGLISDFFQSPDTGSKNREIYEPPITNKFIEQIWQMTLTGKMGIINLKKNIKMGEDFTLWTIDGEKKFPANVETINALLNSLKKIQIRKIFNNDPINLANFSLDNPLLTLSLKTIQNEETTIKLGLINPIDNTTYITFENDDKFIYQIDNLVPSFSTIGLTDFIDSKIFSIFSEEIKKMTVYKFPNLKKSPILQIIKKNEKWYNKQNHHLSKKEVEDYLEKITALKGIKILDQKGPEEEKIINRYLSRPLYKIELRDLKDRIKLYTISNIISKPIPALKLNKKQNIIVKASDREFPYILSKSSLILFDKKDKTLPVGTQKGKKYF